MKVIGIAGQMAVAKDTVANYLVQKLGNDWSRDAFANAVKRVYCETFNKDMDFIEKWKRISEPPPGMLMSVRQSLQFIGDGFRKMQSDIWIDIQFRKTNSRIISDLRYINELKAVKKHGGINILMYRPGFLNNDPNPSESQIKPVIECFIKNGKEGVLNLNYDMGDDDFVEIDIFLINDGNLEDLYKKVDNMILPYIVSKFGR